MRYLIYMMVVFLLLSCGNSKNSNAKVINDTDGMFGDVKVPKVCNVETKKEFVFNLMHDSYLWSNDVKSIQRVNDLNSSEDVLKEMKVDSDKFSHIITVKKYNDLFEAGVDSGFGYFPSLIADDNNTEYINVDFIYPDSPASKVGLKRGDLIEYMDGNSIYSIRRDNDLFDKYFGSDKEDENLTVLLKLKDNTQTSITKKEYPINTVLHHSIINQNGKKIAYIVFESFISKSYAQLENSFKEFSKQGVDELILDLRYNGGGIVSVANYLSSMIAGDRVRDKIFNKYIFNEKYSNNNSYTKFQKNLDYSLNLPRVFVITTEYSCSSSELVINSLKSSDNDVEVIQIGSSTCGKPYGMIGGAFCDKYILPVQFKTVNGDGNGDYVEGIDPTCEAVDDISRDFGDVNESSLSDALYYIKNDSCRKSVRSVKKSYKRDDIIKGFDRTYGLF